MLLVTSTTTNPLEDDRPKIRPKELASHALVRHCSHFVRLKACRGCLIESLHRSLNRIYSRIETCLTDLADIKTRADSLAVRPLTSRIHFRPSAWQSPVLLWIFVGIATFQSGILV
ncbi:hypothetical protein L228DRAFT_179228 [Xylona heveae TC161]|uniref:Uncharacterized protein n=1 Tax=Xylona heveae (strain CBS 132557 / TC161) TaxID=1328760 RepID=A0A165FB23_XYLHT|nr:hypothetical protein L228DRAFT_179228 [Xylona heveae TC161]KZF20777.1 hypothetical protein L228DRAFT_179228 [Xylona heveae TC161]